MCMRCVLCGELRSSACACVGERKSILITFILNNFYIFPIMVLLQLLSKIYIRSLKNLRL
jgi:hypothetical protein